MKYYLLLTIVIIFFNDKPLTKVNTDYGKKSEIDCSCRKATKKVFSYGGNFSNY